ncbi:MAG: SDR family NAD(P)-dependent oxidoreductase [Caulobacteraceae bacterium]
MRNVLVTGASRGIGLAIARRLIDDGFGVIAVARTPSDALSAAIEAAGGAEGSLRFIPFDLSQVEELADLVRRAKAEAGPIYGLVNNAGLGTSGLLANMRSADIEALVRLNTLSPMLLTRAAVKSMMAQGQGRVVNMASVVAASGFSGLSVYGATKASMVGFTKGLAREVGPLGITVNAVAPGFIDTDMTSNMSAQDRQRVANRSALKRLAGAEDVAAAVAYLMSDGARNITGTVLTVDAGATA